MRYSASKRKQQIIDFRGINYGENHRDGELSFSENLSSDYFPCLSPRHSQGVFRTLTNPNGILAGDDLFYVDGNIIYRNGENFAELDGADTRRKMVIINTKLVIFPDKVYLNLEDKDNFHLTRDEPSDWETNYKAYFIKVEGSEDTYSSVVGTSAPKWIQDRYYAKRTVHHLDAEFDAFGGTVAFEHNKIKLVAKQSKTQYRLKKMDSYRIAKGQYTAYTAEFNPDTGRITLTTKTEKVQLENFAKGDIVKLYRNDSTDEITIYSYGMSGNYTALPGFGFVDNLVPNGTNSTIVELSYYESESFEYSLTEGFCDYFNSGDAIKISGCKMSLNGDATFVVRDVTPTELVFDDNVFSANPFEVGTVKIEREVPEFDVICENNNRLFGADKEKIYVSALGDPTNWNTFDGLSTDSYQVAVASSGKFTGCIGYSGSVLFFKEDMMYKLMGDYPSNFALYSYNVAGVKDGSSESVVNLNESIFYHGRDGVYMYSGSIPQNISAEFGTKTFSDAVGGVFGTKYYISMKSDSGKYELYTYDTMRGIWLRVDDSEVIGFAEHGNDKLMLLASGKIIKLDSGNEVINWSAETCEITEYIDNRKCYSRLVLRLDMYEQSCVEVVMSCDRGEWQTVFRRDYGNTEGEFRNQYTANIPIRPTRCDRFKIRISGVGKVIIRGITRDYEVGSEV